MKEISVVILHYNNLADTTKYIENLRQLNWEGLSYHFIVVDNASPDGSGRKLAERYNEDADVKVLLSDQNLGFAKGNNLGIVYAREQFAADFIAVSNNDIEICNKEFFQDLVQLHSQDPFAVCGPDIYSVGKQFHQSPIRSCLLTLREVEDSISDMTKKLRMVRLLNDLHLYELLRKVKHLMGRGSGGIVAEDHENVQYDVVIHGAFFVLTKEYTEQFPHGLYPETFMYREEDILAYLCAQKRLKIRFCPELQVLHYDGVSTLKATGNRAGKYIFELENTIQSSGKLIELMQKSSGKEIDQIEL